jgi:uncharacterized membrane protein YkoI
MRKVVAVAVALVVSATVAGAQGTSTYNKSAAKPTTQASKSTQPGKTGRKHRTMKKAESQADLQKEAKISEATARATALKEVPNGTVKSSELEREKGKLVYSYDITVPGKTGVEEVNVSATDGSVVGKMHESAKTESKEAAQEAKGKKTAPKK